ncbi:MAG: T9SS type A sorting domain-containing protein, partial [Saprospiraceae bacterium]|nr:T9SS type A sorting domain-containing protein [Saprospiraceae bacterium]
QNDNCQNELVFEGQGCNTTGCDLYGAIVYEQNCTDNGLVDLIVGIENPNPLNNFFDAYLNEEFVFFGPLTPNGEYIIPGVEVNAGGENVLMICINDQPDCCVTITFEGVACPPVNDCWIGDPDTEIKECTEESYYVLLNFEYGNNSNSFTIGGTHQSIDPIGYNELPILIGPFQQGEPGIIDIVDAEWGDCYNWVEIEPYPCEDPESCLSFNDLDPGTNWNSANGPDLPHLLFEQEGVSVWLEECGPMDFYSFEVRDDEFCEVVEEGDNAIFLQGASLTYDFSSLNAAPTTLYFNFCGETELTISGIDQTISVDSYEEVGPIDLGNGFSYKVLKEANGDPTATFYLEGPGITELSICGLESSYGPVCWETDVPPLPTEGCYGFENLDQGSYTPNNTPDLLYEDESLQVSASNEIIGWQYMEILSDPIDPQFNGAIANYAHYHGSLLFDFSNNSEYGTEFVTFDFSGEYLAVKVNEGSEIEFSGLDTTDSLILADNGVVLFFHRESSNPLEGTVSLFGPVEKLWIAGEGLSLDNICYFFEIQEADVWPGDINSNNVADHFDLLYLGIANGSEGPARNNPQMDWQGQTSNDWIDFFVSNGVNYKHADANGDGVVDQEDFLVLKENMGQIHGPVEEYVTTPGTPEDPPIFVDLNADGPLTAGEAFNVPIKMGSIDNPALGVHGVAFSIRFDPEQIDPTTVDVVLDPDGWLGEDLWILKRVLPEGVIEVAITRKDQTNRNGFGGIAYFIGIIDDLVGKEVDTEMDKVKAIGGDESDVLLYAQSSNGNVTTEIEQDAIKAGLHVFPNPTSSILNIRNYNEQDLKRITAHDLLGQQVFLDDDPAKMNTLDFSGLESGVYFVQLYFSYEHYTYKIEVLH